MSTPTPRTDAAWSASFDGAQMSAGQTARALRECSQQLERELTTLIAERDELRADCDNETKWAAHYLAESIAVKGERDQLRAEVERLKLDDKAKALMLKVCNKKARAERAEAIVGKLQELHGCSQEMVVHWCEHAANRSLGLDQARSELATERARLDWLQAQEVKRGLEITEGRDDPLPFLVLGEDGKTHWGNTYRTAIDAAMAEGAK